MENHARFPIMVLRIEIRPEECCEFEKLLLKIHGVHEVALDGQMQKVTIVGDVNPLKLVKYIGKKKGKKTELLVYDKNPKIDGSNPAGKHHKINNAQDSRHNNGNHRRYCKAENCFRRNVGSFQREFGGEADRRRHYHGQFHPMEEIYPNFNDQHCFNGRSRSSNTRFVPTMDREDGHDNRPREHSTHHCKCQAAEEMNKKQQGRYGQFYGRSTDQDTNCCSFPVPDDHDHHHYHPQHPYPAAGGNKFAQEQTSHGRTRYADDEYAQPSFHETKFEDEIEETKRDMNQFFTGMRGRSNNDDDYHLFPGRWSSAYQHDMPPPPPPPPPVYRARPGTHYDKFTNFFSDENPSSCTIV